jgi:hypothetical protein
VRIRWDPIGRWGLNPCLVITGEAESVAARGRAASTSPVYGRLSDYTSKWNLLGKMQMHHRTKSCGALGYMFDAGSSECSALS